MENRMQLQSSCAVCGIKKSLQRCAKCKNIYYCSSAHQHIDWPTHKQECRLMARQKNNNKMQQLQQLQQQQHHQQQLQQGLISSSSLSPTSSSSTTSSETLLANLNSNYNGIPLSHNAMGNELPNQLLMNNPTLLTNGYNHDTNFGTQLQRQQHQQQQQQQTMLFETNENDVTALGCQIGAANCGSSGGGGGAGASAAQFQFGGNNLKNGFSTVHEMVEQMQFCDSISDNNFTDNNLGGVNEELVNNNSLIQQQQQQQKHIDKPIVQQNHQYQEIQQQQHMHDYNQSLLLQQNVKLPQTTQQQQQQQQQQFVPQFSNSHNNQIEKRSSYQIGGADVIGNANERRNEELCRNIIGDMNQYGLSVVDDFLGTDKGIQILNEVHRMYSAGVFQDGQLVNNKKSEQDLRTIRGDKITWVKGTETGCSNVGYLINQIDAVICRANTMLNNGKLGNYNIKERTKAMVACYPGSGSHYVMHVDNPNKDGRVITAIYYLNLNWDTKCSGGVLRIFPESGNAVADIEPKFDRLILFWSDKRNPHEVQPAFRTRYAITVWYFDANEREVALNRCKYADNVLNNAKLTKQIATTTTTAAEAATTTVDSNERTKTHNNGTTTIIAAATTTTSTTATTILDNSMDTDEMPTTSNLLQSNVITTNTNIGRNLTTAAVTNTNQRTQICT